MDLETLRHEYDLARRYTECLYADLREAEVQWRPAPKSSAIAWHLGHQAAVNHYLLRNLVDAEPSLNPRFDAFFDAANPEETRGDTPPLVEIIAYREAVAQRTHAHLKALCSGRQPAAPRAQVIVPILVSLINHEYQHDCWIQEMRQRLGHPPIEAAPSLRVRQCQGYWVLAWP
ncbi:MAG: hypothetical protein KatS3mg131_3492 [Candidatus Tectimicrobiota bacterium]|nr:MAG: hypothetical protein KatS3mg131_3492 [Candidatus Tectomicrobia bacterium]